MCIMFFIPIVRANCEQKYIQLLPTPNFIACKNLLNYFIQLCIIQWMHITHIFIDLVRKWQNILQNLVSWKSSTSTLSYKPTYENNRTHSYTKIPAKQPSYNFSLLRLRKIIHTSFTRSIRILSFHSYTLEQIHHILHHFVWLLETR